MQNFQMHHHLPTGVEGRRRQAHPCKRPSETLMVSLAQCSALATKPMVLHSVDSDEEPFGTLSPLSCAIRWAIVYAGSVKP